MLQERGAEVEARLSPSLAPDVRGHVPSSIALREISSVVALLVISFPSWSAGFTCPYVDLIRAEMMKRKFLTMVVALLTT